MRLGLGSEDHEGLPMTTTQIPPSVARPAPTAEPQTPTHAVIGQRVPKIEGTEKVTGKALYGADQSRPSMLWARHLGSTHAHARIVSIDTSAALAYPGVHAVLTGADLPSIIAAISGTDPAPEEFDVPSRGKRVLAWKKAVFHHEPVAVVAARADGMRDTPISNPPMAAAEVVRKPRRPMAIFCVGRQDPA